MRGLVGEERDLREQDAEDSGDDQLEPAVTQQDEGGDRSAEAERDRGADDDVEPRRALEQSASRGRPATTFVYAWVIGGKLSFRAYVWRTAPRVDAWCGDCSDCDTCLFGGIPRGGRAKEKGGCRSL